VEEAVRNHSFREDLYYRLNVIQIEIPPLRERPDDIVRLAKRLLAFFGKNHRCAPQQFTDDAIQLLVQYSWPGNVRELRNVVERASILCKLESVGAEYLPEKIQVSAGQLKNKDLLSLDKIEEMHIRQVLASTKSLQEASDILGIDQATLWRRRKKYSI